MKLHCVFELNDKTNKWEFVKAFNKKETLECFLDDNAEFAVYTVVETSVKRPPPPVVDRFEQEELYVDLPNN